MSQLGDQKRQCNFNANAYPVGPSDERRSVSSLMSHGLDGSLNRNVKISESALSTTPSSKFEPSVLFKVGVNASRYTVGESTLLGKVKSESAVTKPTPAVGAKASMASLESVTSRYRAGGGSLGYGQEAQNAAVIISMCYNEDATQLAVSLSDGRTRIVKLPNWNNLAADGKAKVTEVILADQEVVYPSISPATTTKWCNGRKNQVVTGYVKGLIKYWNADTGKCLHTIDTGKASITSLCYNPFDAKFAASANNKIFIFDEKAQKVDLVLSGGPNANKMDGHTSKIFQVLYHPFQRSVLLSGGWDEAILIWDERQPRAAAKIPGPHICGSSMDIHNSNHLLVGSYRRESNVQIFDLKTLELLKEIDQYSEFRRKGTPYTQPYATRFLGDDHVVICGSHDPLLKIYDKRDFSIRGCFMDAENSMFCMDIPKTRLDYPIAVSSGNDVYFLDWHSLA